MNERKIIDKVYSFYENWVIPPNNETLLELKRREFKERTKYLNPKVLYTLSNEEKIDLREQGYFVDINDKTLKELQNFKLTYNRHDGKYYPTTPNYNYGFYQTKYYYNDQKIYELTGDPNFLKKLWKVRARFKPYIVAAFGFYIFLNFNYYVGSKLHRYGRNMSMKYYNDKNLNN